ncbi:15513_t:CDS:2, partial [Racocetra persica]
MINSRNVSKDYNSFNVEEFITNYGQGLFCFPPVVSNPNMRLSFANHKLTFNNSKIFGCTWGLKNKSEDMTKVSPSSLENSTVISSSNRAIHKKNILDIERIRN